MRRLFAILVVASLGLWLPGCSLFKKNTGGGGGGDNTPNPTPPPKFPTADSKADPLSGQSRSSGNNGLLAGRVLDGNTRPPGGTRIFFTSADTKDDSSAEELSVSPDGYFLIENLKPGGQYKLTARGKQGSRDVAGIKYATAPNVHLLIQMKEDFVTTATPAVTGPYSTLNEEKKNESTAPQQTKDPPAKEGWQPASGVNVTGSEASLPPMQVAVRPPDGFKQMGGLIIGLPLEMPRKANVPTANDSSPQRLDAPVTLGSTKVPSCALVGEKLERFALKDINGEPWEYRAGGDRRVKAVLLDFWGTWCGYCVKSIPTLKALQNRYGSQGLEVIGIAYEQDGTPEEQAYRVNDFRKKERINYRLLLGSGDDCTVRSNLKAGLLPTLILLDDQGNMIKRYVGLLSPIQIEELNRAVQYLVSRPRAN